jgi:hypothetical protein
LIRKPKILLLDEGKLTPPLLCLASLVEVP